MFDPGSERVRGAGHRFHRQALSPARRRFEAVARVDHQVFERLIGPERHPPAAAGDIHLDLGAAVLGADQTGVSGVELDPSDRLRGSEVELAISNVLLTGREPSLVGHQPSIRGDHQMRIVDRRRSHRQVRMEADAERRRRLGEVRRDGRHEEAALADRVLDGKLQPPWVGRLRMEHAAERDRARRARRDSPREPPHESMDRVRPLRLVQRRATFHPLERVVAVFEAIRPRREDLTPAGARRLGRCEPIQHIHAARVEGPERGTHLGEDGSERSGCDLELLARRRHACADDSHVIPSLAPPTLVIGSDDLEGCLSVVLARVLAWLRLPGVNRFRHRRHQEQLPDEHLQDGE